MAAAAAPRAGSRDTSDQSEAENTCHVTSLTNEVARYDAGGSVGSDAASSQNGMDAT